MTGNTKESTAVIFLRYLFVTALPPDSIYTQDLWYSLYRPVQPDCLRFSHGVFWYWQRLYFHPQNPLPDQTHFPIFVFLKESVSDSAEKSQHFQLRFCQTDFTTLYQDFHFSCDKYDISRNHLSGFRFLLSAAEMCFYFQRKTRTKVMAFTCLCLVSSTLPPCELSVTERLI